MPSTALGRLEIDDSDSEDGLDQISDISDSDCDDINLTSDAEDGEEEPSYGMASDDVHGGALDPRLVEQARKVEMRFVKDRGIYGYATVQESVRETGSKPIGTRWVDTNKGDSERPNYRSRLVAMEFRRKAVDTIFAATPPLEAVRILCSLLASKQPNRLAKGESGYKMGLYDVSRAHFYADAARKVYIKLPPEDPRAAEPGVCGVLLKSMYGCRDAASLWEDHYSDVLARAGFTKGRASPCCFFHRERQIWVVVHGDDFITVSDRQGLEYIEGVLRAAYAIKASVIGPDKNEEKELKALGRIICIHDWGVSYEPDPGHVELVIAGLGLDNSKEVATPCAKVEHSDARDRAEMKQRREQSPSRSELDMACEPESPPLPLDRLKRYQSLAARLNYYSLDRPDLLHPVKELMRRMSDPRECDEMALKRVARYLVGQPRMITSYPWQEVSDVMTIFVDSDFAGCHRTRKSTSGGAILWGCHLIKTWSKTQATIALSTGEAELAAAVRGSTEGLGVQAILEEWNLAVVLTVKSDATAAIGMVKRQGLGRVRHLAVADLWVQQRARLGQLRFEKFPGKLNPSDMMTKGLDRESVLKHLHNLGLREAAGRSALAPKRVL